MDIEARFFAKVRKTRGCWYWTGAKTSNGYPEFYNGRVVGAHRWAYEHFIGPVPPGHDVDHQCHNRDQKCSGGPSCRHRACVRPDHLTTCTRPENVKRGVTGQGRRRRPTHCKRGHEFTPENTIQRPGRPNDRECRRCTLDRRKANGWR